MGAGAAVGLKGPSDVPEDGGGAARASTVEARSQLRIFTIHTKSEVDDSSKRLKLLEKELSTDLQVADVDVGDIAVIKSSGDTLSLNTPEGLQQLLEDLPASAYPMKVVVAFHMHQAIAANEDAEEEREKQAPETQEEKVGAVSAPPTGDKQPNDGDLAKHYTASDSIYDALKGEDVVLIKGSWLVDVACKPNGVLPRRQVLPSEAVWNVKELFGTSSTGKRALVTKIVSISYCWLEPGHPDRKGLQLAMLAKVAKQFLLTSDCNFEVADQIQQKNAIDREWYPCEVLRRGADEGTFDIRILTSDRTIAIGANNAECQAVSSVHLRRRGETWTDFSTFLDWCSMFQAPRSALEQEGFERSLSHINLWYASALTDVWMLTAVPIGCESLPYKERGWPNFERAVAEMITTNDKLLDLGMFDEVCCPDFDKTTDNCKVGRSPPQTPDDFLEVLKAKKFTNGADSNLVEKKYRQTFNAVMAGGSNLCYTDLQWAEKEALVLARSLRHCPRLRIIDISRNPLGDHGIVEIARSIACCVNLKILKIVQCAFGIDGASALAESLVHLLRLTELNVGANNIGPRGVGALSQACPQSLEVLRLGRVCMRDEGAELLTNPLPRLPNLKTLSLGYNDITAIGAKHLAPALKQMKLKTLTIRGNCIGDEAAILLLEAVSTADFVQMAYNGISDETKATLRKTWKQRGKGDKDLTL